jgi:uncharacterized damage-inducible protein DinB
MNKETLLISEKMKEVYKGDPWYGKSAFILFGEIEERFVFEKPSGQHSILEILWHMINWQEFTLSRLRKEDRQPLHYFETNDWRDLDHGDKTLWAKGLARYREVHDELATLVAQQEDGLLSRKVDERNYDFRKLLYGILEHDIYHLGQIAYSNKMR